MVVGPPTAEVNAYGTLWAPQGGVLSGVATFPNGVVIRSLDRMHKGETLPSGLSRITRETSFDLFSLAGEWMTEVPAEAMDLSKSITGAWSIATDGAFWITVVGDCYKVVRYEIQFAAEK